MPHHKPLVSATFEVPNQVVTDRFLIRPLCYADALFDYEAWQSSLEHLRGVFGPDSDWPDPTMLLQENAIDLAWHQREHEQRGSFAYTVFDPANVMCLGCIYINPARKVPFDAEVFYWVRTSALQDGLDKAVGDFVKWWLADIWPFDAVAYPGREVSWEDFAELADKEHW